MGIPVSGPEHGKLAVDVVALAFSLGTSRVHSDGSIAPHPDEAPLARRLIETRASVLRLAGE